MPTTMKRAAYADMFGPTTGDRRAACRHRSDHRSGKGFHHLRRGGEIRRRQGDPRRHGPIADHQSARRGRYGHHQCADPRSLGHRQSRCRHQGRAHCGDRQSRQSRHSARRHDHHRPRHRDHRRRRKNPHRRWLRCPHSFHLPTAGRRSADVRRDVHARRRHRSRSRHERDHLHARAVPHRPHDPGR